MKYKTKQRQTLLAYLETVRGRHVTVGDMLAHFRAEGQRIGATTIYRQVEELVREGALRKYIVDENSPACYEYAGDGTGDAVHCKCEGCGRLFHIRCEHFDAMRQHLAGDHDFAVNPTRTVLYGLCDHCRTEAPPSEEGPAEA